MPRKPSRVVAVIAALALAACSSIGTINGQRLDIGNPPSLARRLRCIMAIRVRISSSSASWVSAALLRSSSFWRRSRPRPLLLAAR